MKILPKTIWGKRALLVFLAAFIGFLVILFLIGEMVVQH